MSKVSRFAFGLAVAVSACADYSAVEPRRQSFDVGPTVPLASPEVSVMIPPGVTVVVVSWTYDSSSDVSGFLVERAASQAGSWSNMEFTTNHHAVDDLDIGEHSCYRVTAVTSNPDSPPSRPICVLMG